MFCGVRSFTFSVSYLKWSRTRKRLMISIKQKLFRQIILQDNYNQQIQTCRNKVRTRGWRRELEWNGNMCCKWGKSSSCWLTRMELEYIPIFITHYAHNACFITVILAVVVEGFPGGSKGKESALQCRRPRFNPWIWKVPGEGNGYPL